MSKHEIVSPDVEQERPFVGKKVYYSGSINGTPEADPEFAWKLVQYMGKGGADVLSEHVAARSHEEMEVIRTGRVGREILERLQRPDFWYAIREQDVAWVEEATHFVGLVNAPSHGVGMEIERALLKPRLGLNRTPILALVHEERLRGMSNMIRGIDPAEHPEFQLATYTDLNSAERKIYDFLVSN